MIIVQKVSRMFAAGNRTITSADMAYSRYVPTDNPIYDALKAIYAEEHQEWLVRLPSLVRETTRKLRTSALAAKANQGKGPPSSTSWRGRERNIQFRSQS